MNDKVTKETFKKLCFSGQFWCNGHEQQCDEGNYNSMSLYIFENHIKECEQCQEALGLTEMYAKLNALEDKSQGGESNDNRNNQNG